VLGQAHGVDEGILRWRNPLLQEQRTRRSRDDVTEHEEEPCQEQDEEMSGQSLRQETGEFQQQ
jgi:hypothetical protein